jgi:hypothetical protein
MGHYTLLKSLSMLSRIPLIYVWIGDYFPYWINNAINLSKNNSGLEVILISNKIAGKNLLVDRQIYIEDQ